MKSTRDSFVIDCDGVIGRQDAFQNAAMKSILWYETVNQRMHLDPIPFAYVYLMRTGRVSDERLRRIDPEVAELLERHHLSLSSQSR